MIGMKRRLLAALFLAAFALDAAAQRVSLEVPLSPVPSLGAAAAVSPLAGTFPLALSPWTPALAAPSIQIPLNATPITLAPVKAAAAIAPLRSALIPAAAAPSKPLKQSPKVIDSLREHGAAAGELAGLKGEAGASALERNFLAAASLGDGSVPPAADGAAIPAVQDARPLATRMLERVRLDDRGRADEKKALEDAFTRLVETPTGRRYAEEFLAEGLTAHVHFEDFPDSQLFLVDGRKKFYAAQAYTDWRPEGYAEIRLNRHYVDGDPEYLRESLPSIIGHELLGHGLWYGRAAKQDLYLAFHYHELNETLARLVGWAIDHELDGRFEEAGAWSYLADPAHYLSNLKMRMAYYALTFGQKEMSDPLGTMRSRLAAAELELERSRANLAAQKTWLPVLEHFEKHSGLGARRFELLRTELADLVTHYEHEIVNSESVVREITGLISRLEAEPDRASERYLAQASANPFFDRLSADTARLGAQVQTLAHSMPPAAPRPAVPRPADQITWEQLIKMHNDRVNGR
jgi:hypothetical protein